MARWLVTTVVSMLLATYTQSQFLYTSSDHPFGGYSSSHFSRGPHEGIDIFYPNYNYPSAFGIDSPDPQPVAQCTPQIRSCNKNGYRTIDGSCNHFENPLLGVANMPYGRLLPAKYADGVVAPPVSVTGENLTSARDISEALFPDSRRPDPLWTLSTMQYGQIITHDMALAAGTTQGKAHSTKCCSQDLDHEKAWDSRDQACFPIPISPFDPVYSKAGQRCMEFVRSTNDFFQGCNRGDKPAEQISAVTAYLDSSNVYGSSEDVANSLREFQGGRLRVDVKNGRPFPPPNPNKTSVCDHVHEEEACYLTGDGRANQNPQLTVIQILQLREHNRIAQALQEMNPHWDDERLYQEARKIAIAEHQLVTYYEWLPIILGEENMLKNKLIYRTDGHVEDYDPKVDPSVLNGFSTSAFRFLHNNIQGFLGLYDEHRSSSAALRLSDHFNRPQIIEEGNNFDDLARGMHTQPQDYSDKYFTTEITWFLFRNGHPLGQDLRAIDIQRGRDHGLASYNDYRGFCGLPKAHTFEDFLDVIDPEDVEKLKQLYAYPDDVDVVVGGSLEKLASPALVGPTYLCIITEQFYRSRVGDRHFFESPGQFTHEQLNELRKGSISRLICDNGDNVQHMQPRGFEIISDSNPLVPCSELPSPSLEPWREQQHPESIFQQPQSFAQSSDASFFHLFKK